MSPRYVIKEKYHFVTYTVRDRATYQVQGKVARNTQREPVANTERRSHAAENKGVPDLAGHCQDILEVARLISSTANPESIMADAVEHLARRLHKRARCAILEGNELVLKYWSGEYESPLDGTVISRESVVWKIFEDGSPVNLTDPHQTDGYKHTLRSGIKIKAVVPFGYAEPLTQKQRKMGVLIVDSGKNGVPVSELDFEYLKIISYLIGSAAGKAQLLDQFTGSCVRQQEIVRETAHNFRNRIAVIGGLCRRIQKLNVDKGLKDDVSLLYSEVRTLEAHVKRFEKYMNESP
jgi:hypothetical protein